MDTGEWVTSTIAVLALAVAVVALVVAVRSARIAGRETSAVVVGTAPPVAAAVEIVAAQPVGVAWKIEHDAGITWLLRNVGTEPAFDVNVIGQPTESAGLVRVERSFADIGTNGSLSFHVVRTAHHPNITGLAVTWSGQDQPVVVPME